MGGFERTLASVTGLANVRDAIPFPRTPGTAVLLEHSRPPSVNHASTRTPQLCDLQRDEMSLHELERIVM